MKKGEVIEKGSNHGIIGFVIGIIGIIDALFTVNPLAGLALGIIGLTFSVKDKSKLGKRGKVLNIIAISLGIILAILLGAMQYNLINVQ